MAKALATKPTEVALSDGDAFLNQYAGAGTSQRPEDNITPLLVVLQPLSPQVIKGHSARIDGAEAGDLWLRSAPTPIIRGEDGLIFQPCFYDQDYVEWLPRPPKGPGGFVARHRELPKEATTHPDNPNKFVLPRGDDGFSHELIHTRYHVGIAWLADGAFPYVIPLSSTGHTVSKQWMGLINSHLDPAGNVRPSFAYRYKLTTRMRTKGDKNFYVMVPQPFDSLITLDDGGRIVEMDRVKIELGAKLFEAFRTGAKTAAAQTEDHEENTGGDAM